MSALDNPAVIFDLGNVILEWDTDGILASLNLSNSERGLLRDELFAHRDWLDLDHGKKTEAQVTVDICARSDLTIAAVEQALLSAKQSLAIFPETIHLMRELQDRGIKMFCLSNMSREIYDHIKDESFFEMFSGIVISGIEGCMKPQAEIYHLIVERFDLTPASTLFIDDSLANIDKARELGIVGYHFKRSENCYSEIKNLLYLT